MLTLCTELLYSFIKQNMLIVKEMEVTSHHFDYNNINPFHGEGSVWAHTMIMYSNFLKEIQKKSIQDEKLILKLAIIILCHDIGKVYTRNSFNEFGKVNFYSHSFASVQPTIDFVLFLNSKGYNLNNEDLYEILLVISNHMDFMENKELNTRKLLCNNKENILLTALYLKYFDTSGSIGFYTNFNVIESVIAEYNQYKDIETGMHFVEEPPEILMICGVSGIGKDTFATKQQWRIVSLDECRINEYKRSTNVLGKTKASIYNEAFNATKGKDSKLLNLLKTDLIALNPNPYAPVAVCNTHLTRKLRKSILPLVKDKVIHIIYLVNASDIILNRNKHRDTKHISSKVVYKFFYNQQIPCLFEIDNNKISNIELIVY